MPGRNRQTRPPRQGNALQSHQASHNLRSGRSESSSHPPVPAYCAIKPGSGVSITLKQDQGTDTEVQGFVADVLTRGDHSRGVKVRLVDGRVGRVQRLVPAAAGSLGNSGASADLVLASHVFQAPKQSDIQSHDGKSLEQSGLVNLGDYVVFKKQKVSKQANVFGAMQGVDTFSCPICKEFEGDEMAVAYHVDKHVA